MTLFTKLALYNTVNRLVLIGILWLFLPWLLTWLNDQQVASHPIRVGGQTYILLGGILVLMFLIDLGYVHFLLRPLRKIISQKLRVIQDPGQFDFSPLPTTTLELSQLDGHINELMRQLNSSFTREKAFASQASHELLTPITVLRTRFDNLIADEQTPPHVAIQLVESQQTLLRLSKLVQKLLRLARIENHQYLKNDTVSIRKVLDDVLHSLDDHIVLKDIQVALELDEDIVLAPANQMLLYTMVLNLVGNAVRYNADHGKLCISRAQVGQQSTLTIRDTGSGMKPAQIATLTEHGQLNKVTGERTDSEMHNGIGLQLIRTIALFHAIDLSVDAQPDQGTGITLTFRDSR